MGSVLVAPSLVTVFPSYVMRYIAMHMSKSACDVFFWYCLYMHTQYQLTACKQLPKARSGQPVGVRVQELLRCMFRFRLRFAFLTVGPCVQDTVTGFLLAGVGNVDARRKTNFLIVDSSTFPFSAVGE